MNLDADSHEAFECVLNRLLDDGSMDDYDRDFLAEAVHGTGEAQALYVDWLLLDELLKAELMEAGAGERDLLGQLPGFAAAQQPALGERQLQPLVPTEAPGPAQPVAQPAPALPPAPPDVSQARHGLPPVTGFLQIVGARLSQLGLAGSVLVVGVPMLLIGYFAALLGMVVWDQIHRSDALVKAPVVAPPQSFAVLSNAVGCRWEAGGPATIGQRVANRNLRLERGSVDVQLDDGTRIVIEGPAEFEINSPHAAFLKQGRLLAQVPSQAVGFTVETPTARVVDLGTEFIVEVNRAAETQLAVTSGVVELTAIESSNQLPSTGGDTPDASAAGHGELIRAGQAVAVLRNGSGQWQTRTVPIEASRLTKPALTDTPRPKSNTTAGRHAFVQAVLDTPGLVGYWKLDEAGPPTAADEVERSEANRQTYRGRTPGAFRHFAMGDFRRPGATADATNSAVNFNGEDSHIDLGSDATFQGGWLGLTITAWVRPERPVPHAILAGRWTNTTSEDQFALFVNGLVPDIAVGDGTHGAQGMVAKNQLPVGQWTFLAGTWEADTRNYHLYLNGERDPAVGKSEGGMNTRTSSPLLIGGQTIGSPGVFDGQIDEVSIFKRALSPEEIQNLYRLAKRP